MSKLIFSHHLQPEYILGKDLNLLPFELFAHVKAGRLHPLDKDTGQPIPRPDILKIKKRLEEIEQEIKVFPFEEGKINALYRGQKKEAEKGKLDSRAEELQKEYDPLSKKLDVITDINDWTTSDPPKEPKHLITHLPIDLMKAFDILKNARFHNDEIRILNIETPLDASEKPDNVPPKAPAPIEESAPAPQIEPQAENYFKRNGKHWAIKYKNEVADHIDHVDGLLYIAHLLEKPGKDISDQTLHQLAKGVALKETIDANEMIERNLSKGFKPQPIGTDKQRKICQAKYQELQGKLETASLEEQDEINEKMDKLVPFLNMKKRNFADPNDRKAQSNMKKRIDLAYDKLKEENMPELAMYLNGTIKTGDYGRRYVGPVTWKIEINK
jgi:hypothetical protein